jgi:hypothetical protein
MLPPILKSVVNGTIEWQKMDRVDYQKLGYFLSCHLIIEHHIEEFLKIMNSNLSWDSVQLNFSQKVSLISDIDFPSEYNFISELKHLNTLRNKLSHRIDFEIKNEDFLPFLIYLKKTYKKERQVPVDNMEILEQFTSLVCSFLAGWLAAAHSIRGLKSAKKRPQSD